MSEINNKEVLKTGNVSIKTKTAAGAAYVTKVTHPPSTKSDDFRGVPDCSAPNVVHLELKAEDNFPPILTLATGTDTTVTTNTSSMLFLQTSGNSTAVYCFLGNGQDWCQPFGQASTVAQPSIDQVCKPASRFNGYNFSNFTQDCASKRTTYKSTTYYLNATNFNNQGTVTIAKFKPTIFGADTLTTYYRSITDEEIIKMHKVLPPNWKSAIEQHIKTNKKVGTEADLHRAAVEAIGTSYIVQIFYAPSTGVIVDLPESNMTKLVNVLPQNAGQLLQSSPKSVSMPAKDGAFVVQQPVDPVQLWTNNFDTSGSVTPVVGVNDGLVACFIKTGRGSSAMISSLLSYPATSVTPVGAISSSSEVIWDNLDWAMVLFEGLTVPPTVGTTLTSVPYITTKSFVGIETQPTLNSSWQPFLESLPLPDPDALEMATGIFHSRPDALPASANDLGSIASTIVKFIPTAVTWLKDLFGNKQQKENAMGVAKKFIAPKPAKQPKPKVVYVQPKPRRSRSRQVNLRTPLPYENNTYTNNRPKSRSKSRGRQRSKSAPRNLTPKPQRRQSTMK
jgi:hypothetical protein